MRLWLGLWVCVVGLGCGPIVVVDGDDPSQASGGGGPAGVSASASAGGGTSGTTSETPAPEVPVPEILAIGVTGVALAIDEVHLYFTSEYSLWRMPKEGGTPELLVSDLWEAPQGIAVDGAYLYWQGYSGESIHRASLAGGLVEIVASGLGTSPQWLALDAARVYFPTDGTPTSVMSAPKDGGPAQTHATGGDPNHVAVDATHVYWVGQEGAHRVDKLGGSAETLSTAPGSLRGVAVDDADVFFANPSTGSILKVSKLGGSEVELVTGEENPSLDAAGEGHVYWTNYLAEGKVARASKAGGSQQVLAEAQNRPIGLVVDGSHAYWVNTGDQTIVRVPLP